MTYSQKNPIAFNEKPASSVKMNEEFVQIYGALNEIDGLKAPLESPALTGSPTAPTQAADDDSTKLATTAFVKDVVADYAPLESPALTGFPTAPTQPASDNSTKIATTKFVKDQEYFNKVNILGTVSQSSGFPTGAVIERGSNANGEYVKFADGTVICWASGKTLTYKNDSVLSITWTFPVQTVGAAFHSIITSTPAAGHRDAVSYRAGVSNSSVELGVIDDGAGFSSGDTLGAGLFLIGRWF